MRPEFNQNQKDALIEIYNIGLYRAADILRDMVQERIDMKIPTIEMIETKNLDDKFPNKDGRVVGILMNFTGPLKGLCGMCFSQKHGVDFVRHLVDESEGDSLDYFKVSTLSEVGNIVSNSVIWSLLQEIGGRFNYEQPLVFDSTITELRCSALRSYEHSYFSNIKFMWGSEAIGGDLIIALENQSNKRFLNTLDSLVN